MRKLISSVRSVSVTPVSVLCFIICVLSMGFGLYIRLRGLPGSMLFFGDQGQDLLVALRIVRGEFFPIIGPPLSVSNLFIPPTYYYFLALLLYIFKSEAFIIYVYAAMNILSGIFFALYLKHKTDTLTATIFFSLYMVAFQSAEQARSLWQPFPTTFFVSAALLVMLTAEKRHSYRKILLSIVLFTIGITIYPGAALLAPMFLFQWYSVFTYTFHNKRMAWFASIVSFTIALLAASMSWILHEIANKFPIFHAIINSGGSVSRFVFYDSLQGVIRRILLHLTAMYRLIIPDPIFYSPLLPYKNIIDLSFFFFLGLLIFLLYKTTACKKFNRFLFSLGFQYLLIGILPLIFFNTLEHSTHHVLVLLPFLLFIISYTVSLSFISPNIFIKFMSIIPVIIFCLTNFSTDLFTHIPIQSYNDVSGLYSFLVHDIRSRDQSLTSYDYKIATLQDGYNYNYEGQPLSYLFKKYDNYPVLFTKDGNDTQRQREIAKNTPFAYLICFPQSLNGKQCWDMFRQYNSKTTIFNYMESGPYSIYLVKNNAFTQ